MSSVSVRNESSGDERAIRSLSRSTGAALADVRALFSKESARLALGARIRSYLPALTAANVRALLRAADRQRAGRAPGA